MYELLVKGMTCEHCVNRVKKLASGVEGVQDVQVDLESGRVNIQADETTKTAVVAAISKFYEVVN